ncbi:acetyl-CoA hydrolase/transferase family protein [Clostridium sp.]
MDYNKMYTEKVVSIKEAASKINSGDQIYLSGGNSAPIHLVSALCKRVKELENVDIFGALLMYPHEFLNLGFKGHINYHTFFLGPIERSMRGFGNVEATSIHFSKAGWMAENIIKPNVAMIETAPPDENGNMNFGPTGAGLNEIILKCATVIIVQVNRCLPVCMGESNSVNLSDVDFICEKDHPLPQLPQSKVTEIDKKIASYILPQIPDGATIQIGLGGIANAVAYGLEEKKDLGIHSEMLTDSMVHLAKKGVINCSKKNYNKNKIICSFGMGNLELYQFMDKNPLIHVAPIFKVNNSAEIAKNDNFISINTALMVDLTGQVGSEAIGFNQFSGTGGALDFVEGAVLAKNGKSFICLASTVKAKDGIKSTISISLPPGTAVTIPRANVQYIVTEYGIANLYNMSIEKRVRELIKIAHPDFREELLQQAKDEKLIY